MALSTEEILKGVISGDKRMLGKAITLVESRKEEHREQAEALLQMLMPHTGDSLRIGITGVPGVGKSTFIENFGLLAISKGKKVAVLAIDPSSSLNKGSILGDKTRMEELARNPAAFIRPSPSSGVLGGIANTTFETMLICEAAGYNLILIETVGVGQSEVMVSDITDVLLFLKIVGGGDELQGIKRGIMEMADLIFINKAEGDLLQKAKTTKIELLRALSFLPSKENDWKVPVLLGSALKHQGLEEVYQKLVDFIHVKKNSGRFDEVRMKQAEKRFDFWVQQFILHRAQAALPSGQSLNSYRKNASELRANPFSEAKKMVDKLFDDLLR